MCNNDCNCISEILSVILTLQENACGNACLETCDRGFLGCGLTNVSCNTRPIMLYTAASNGETPWTMPTTKTDEVCDETGTGCSSVFRIEKLDGCCATFRVLAANPIEDPNVPYVSTTSFFTLNLNCCCCIRCLADTYVEGI